jgi:hypothetical protein
MIWSTTPSYSWIYFDSRKEKVSDPWRGLSGLLERHPFSGLVHSARELFFATSEREISIDHLLSLPGLLTSRRHAFTWE